MSEHEARSPSIGLAIRPAATTVNAAKIFVTEMSKLFAREKQCLDLQLDALRKAGCPVIEQDHGVSGASSYDQAAQFGKTHRDRVLSHHVRSCVLHGDRGRPWPVLNIDVPNVGGTQRSRRLAKRPLLTVTSATASHSPKALVSRLPLCRRR